MLVSASASSIEVEDKLREMHSFHPEAVKGDDNDMYGSLGQVTDFILASLTRMITVV